MRCARAHRDQFGYRMSPTEYRTIRKQLGLTQAGLAALLGETRETISRREKSTGIIPKRDEYALRWLAERETIPAENANVVPLNQR